MMEPRFIHLRLHTEYSIRDGLASIPSLIQQAAPCRMPALAITDQSNLYATVKFYQAAIAAGIKPILGADLEVISDQNPQQTSRLTLFCQTNEGYQNLIQLVSRSYLEGQINDQPTIQKSWLTSLNTNGLLALGGAEKGDIGKALLSQNEPAAKIHLKFWQSLFPDRFYLEISRVGKKEEYDYIEYYKAQSNGYHSLIIEYN